MSLELTRMVKAHYTNSAHIPCGSIWINTSEVQVVEAMHFSCWWAGWEAFTDSEPNCAANVDYYKKNYPTSVSGEFITRIVFKGGTDRLVLGIPSEIAALIFEKGC